MSILEVSICEARIVTGGGVCVGPVDAVRCLTARSEMAGCVVHAAMLKTCLPVVRWYPGSVDGAAIAAFYLAGQAGQCSVEELTARARELLARYAGRVSAGVR